MREFKHYPFEFIDDFDKAGFWVLIQALFAVTLAVMPIAAMSKQNERLVVLPFEIVDNEYDLARKVGGDKVMIGWIHKMSILVLTMHIKVKDVASEKTIISKAYDFRGDNEKAWLRAARYMVRDLGEKMGK
jgi:hypothetical protein